MVGRGILSNPWLFSGKEDIPTEERIRVLMEHANLFNEVWGERRILVLLRSI
jgi:tRNA-dihydrouridine synthase